MRGFDSWTRLVNAERGEVTDVVDKLVFAVAGGNTSGQWTGLIWAVGLIGLLVWLFTIPVALVVITARTWTYWQTQWGKQL